MTNTLANITKKALSQVGGYFPGNSPYGVWYDSAYAGNKGVYDAAQFCAMGLSWVFASEGAADIFPMHAYTPSGVEVWKAKGQWHPGTKGIQPGDVIYFDFPGDPKRVSHVGLALSKWNNGVDTVEFNTSGHAAGDQRNGRVVARKRRTASIVGYGRPVYGSGPTPPPAQDSKEPFIIPNLYPGTKTGYEDDWQFMLREMGYNVAPDGSYGPDTKQKTKNYQAAAGLTQDGAAGPITLSSALLRDGDRVLALGDHGADVVLLQFIVGAEPDASFGPLTKAAVQAVQRYFGVNPDGVCGPLFVAKYRAEAAK